MFSRFLLLFLLLFLLFLIAILFFSPLVILCRLATSAPHHLPPLLASPVCHSVLTARSRSGVSFTHVHVHRDQKSDFFMWFPNVWLARSRVTHTAVVLVLTLPAFVRMPPCCNSRTYNAGITSTRSLLLYARTSRMLLRATVLSRTLADTHIISDDCTSTCVGDVLAQLAAHYVARSRCVCSWRCPHGCQVSFGYLCASACFQPFFCTTVTVSSYLDWA